jgi:hypothetical protein
MGVLRKQRWWAGLAALMCAAQLHATIFEVTVDTTGLDNTAATLAFDLTSGDPDTGPSSVSIIGFSGTGASFALGDALLDPDPNPNEPPPTLNDSVVVLNELSFFNEFLQQLTLGTSFTFRFSTTGSAPSAQFGTPDAFSFFLLDELGASLVMTGDVGDPQAILRYNIGSNAADLFEIDSPEGVSATLTEVANGVPEPTAISLVLSGLLALGVMRGARLARQRRV